MRLVNWFDLVLHFHWHDVIDYFEPRFHYMNIFKCIYAWYFLQMGFEGGTRSVAVLSLRRSVKSFLSKSLLYFISDQCAKSSLKVKMSWSLSVKQEPEDHLDISMFHALSLSLSLSLSHKVKQLQSHPKHIWMFSAIDFFQWVRFKCHSLHNYYPYLYCTLLGMALYGLKMEHV